MTRPTIAGEIHAFLRDQILSGQDEGLTATTPLLELGILDSFGLFKLVAHLNEVYPIGITADQIAGRDFKNIEAIATLVARRLESAPRIVQPEESHAQPEGVAVLEAPACAQVFIMFLGQGHEEIRGHTVAGAARDLLDDAPEFFKRAGLGNRNIILFHDERGRSYTEGVSADLPTRATIYERLTAWITQRPHIEEIYCIGVSAGGPMAMLAGDFLSANTVWAFAPRTPRRTLSLAKDTHDDLAQFAQRVTGKTLRQLEEGMTPADQEKIDAHVTPEMVDAYYRSLLDPDKLLDAEHLAEVVDTLSRGNGVTEHRVYYVPRDACDARVADALKNCPGVRPIAVEPSDAPPPPWAFTRWVHPMRWVCRDHMVLDLLRERGTFSTLFPAFRPACLTTAGTRP